VSLLPLSQGVELVNSGANVESGERRIRVGGAASRRIGPVCGQALTAEVCRHCRA